MAILALGSMLANVAKLVVEDRSTKGGIAQIQYPTMVETTVLEIHLEQ